MTAHLTVFQRDLARRLRSKGMSLRAIANEVGCSPAGIDVVLRGQQARVARPDVWTPRDGRLKASDREEILLGRQRGESMSALARALGISPSTVTREVKLGGGPNAYRVWPAHIQALERTKRPTCPKLSAGPFVTWSPHGCRSCGHPRKSRIDYAWTSPTTRAGA